MDPGVQHRGQFRHQHQLAGLQRRGLAELLQPDGRPHGAELRQRGGRPLRAGGPGARHQPPLHTTAGQLLGRPDPRHPLRAAAAVPAAGAAAGLAGRAADLLRLRPCHHLARRRADHPARPGGQPDRHQAAGHQRRRLLRRQLGPSVREPERLEQPVRSGLDHPDPGGAGIHLRPLREGPAPEPRDPRLHAAAVLPRPGPVAVGRIPAEPGAGAVAGRAGRTDGGQGESLRHRRQHAGRSPPPPPRTAR